MCAAVLQSSWPRRRACTGRTTWVCAQLNTYIKVLTESLIAIAATSDLWCALLQDYPVVWGCQFKRRHLWVAGVAVGGGGSWAFVAAAAAAALPAFKAASSACLRASTSWKVPFVPTVTGLGGTSAAAFAAADALPASASGGFHVSVEPVSAAASAAACSCLAFSSRAFFLSSCKQQPRHWSPTMSVRESLTVSCVKAPQAPCHRCVCFPRLHPPPLQPPHTPFTAAAKRRDALNRAGAIGRSVPHLLLPCTLRDL